MHLVGLFIWINYYIIVKHNGLAPIKKLYPSINNFYYILLFWFVNDRRLSGNPFIVANNFPGVANCVSVKICYSLYWGSVFIFAAVVIASYLMPLLN